ncbi:ABC transporter substrate-binding protein [Thermogladius sp. 4427co]|uniref:ABC transporter substrate-binding protein n=1 Tax=Thermogladius sp. 4427co TaxID=3450718 RepID=UPI003F78E840
MKKLALAILIAVLIASLAAYFYYTSHRGYAEKIVVYAYNDRITGIDPSLEDDTGLVVLGSVYEPLLYYDPINNQTIPALAERWEARENNTVWIFYLRKGVVFHDGTPFNSSAVVVSVKRAKEVYEMYGIGLGYIWDAVEDVTPLDDYTVEFKLRYPQRLDLIAASSYAAYIFNPNALIKAGVQNYTDLKLRDWFNTGRDEGTGPYRIVSYDPYNEVVLVKFDKWWGWSIVNNDKAPDKVIIKIKTDPQEQYNGLVSGDIDIVTSIPRISIRDVISRGFKYVNLTTFHSYFLVFNTRRYPTNITEFRLAILYAIPWDRIVEDAMKGYALLGSGYLPHYFPGFQPGLTYQYNITKARELMEKSGVKPGVTIEFMYQTDYKEEEDFASILKSSLAQIGVNVKLVPATWDAMKDAGKAVWENPENTPHMLINDWWPTIISPYDYLYNLFHSDSKEWNWSGFANETFNNLVDNAFMLEGTDYGKAMELYRQAQEILFEQGVAANLWDEIKVFVYNPRINIPNNAVNPLYMYVIFFQYVQVTA